MPGIFALISKDGRDYGDFLNSSIKMLSHFETDEIETLQNDVFFAGIVRPTDCPRHTQVLVDKESNSIFLLRGWFYGIEHLYNGSGKSISDVQVLKDLFLKHKEDTFTKLKGQYFVCIWDGNTQTAYMSNDRYGLVPMYYTETKDFFALAPEIKCFINPNSLDEELDLVAVSEFFSFGYILGDKTYLKNVRLFPPASVVIFKGNHLEIKEYWDYRFPEDNVKPEMELIDESYHLHKQAMRRCVAYDEKTFVPLSGGLDSRNIVAYLDQMGTKVFTSTYGYQGCHEHIYSKKVAQLLGLQNEFYELLPTYIKDHCDLIVSLSDGMMSLCHAHNIPSMINDKARGFRGRISGYLGEDIAGGNLIPIHISQPDYRKAKTKNEKINYILKRHNSLVPVSQIESLVQSINRYGDLGKDLKDHIHSQIRSDEPSARVQDYFDFLQRQRRHVLILKVITVAFMEYLLPFTDYDLFDFYTSLPYKYREGEYVSKHNIYVNTFKKYFPELAKIPWQMTNAPIDSSLVYRRIKKGHFYVSYAFKRGLEIISRGKLTSTVRRFWAKYDTWLRNELKEWTCDNINEMKKVPFLKHDFVTKLATQHMTGTKNNAETLLALITFGQWYLNSSKMTTKTIERDLIENQK